MLGRNFLKILWILSVFSCSQGAKHGSSGAYSTSHAKKEEPEPSAIKKTSIKTDENNEKEDSNSLGEEPQLTQKCPDYEGSLVNLFEMCCHMINQEKPIKHFIKTLLAATGGNNNSCLQMVEYLGTAKNLVLSNRGLITIEPLGELTNLESLRIDQNFLTSLKGIEKMSNLKKLNAKDNDISDISSLSSLKRLENLDLSKNKISSLAVIKDLSSLKELRVAENSITKLDDIKTLVQLTILDVSQRIPSSFTTFEDTTKDSNESTDKDASDSSSVSLISNFSVLSNFINLKELYLAYNQIKDPLLISRLTQLEVLDIRGNELTNIDFLEGLTLLQLRIQHNRLQNVESLKTLGISDLTYSPQLAIGE